MGKKDSSLTRVVPLFDALMDKDATGNLWLPQLLEMGSRAAGCLGSTVIGPLLVGHRRWWGDKERRMEPPKALLQWLVRNVKPPRSKALWGSAETRQKREQLSARDPDTVSEALLLLEGNHKARAWFVLEGRSQPDVFLETDSLILVIEGKRTEREATASTTWMPQRSQMLRHMDAAMEIRGGKRVLGLMITEGPGGADAIAPSDYWINQAELQVREDTLTESLPHRSEVERQMIADGFLGVTTWQRLCAEFGLPWPPAEDVVSREAEETQIPPLNDTHPESSTWTMSDGMRRSNLSEKVFPNK